MAGMNWDKVRQESKSNRTSAAQRERQQAARAASRQRGKVFRSKWTTSCKDCWYSIWKGEPMHWVAGTGGTHMDCVKALNDDTPRTKHPDHLDD